MMGRKAEVLLHLNLPAERRAASAWRKINKDLLHSPLFSHGLQSFAGKKTKHHIYSWIYHLNSSSEACPSVPLSDLRSRCSLKRPRTWNRVEPTHLHDSIHQQKALLPLQKWGKTCKEAESWGKSYSLVFRAWWNREEEVPVGLNGFQLWTRWCCGERRWWGV